MEKEQCGVPDVGVLYYLWILRDLWGTGGWRCHEHMHDVGMENGIYCRTILLTLVMNVWDSRHCGEGVVGRTGRWRIILFMDTSRFMGYWRMASTTILLTWVRTYGLRGIVEKVGV